MNPALSERGREIWRRFYHSGQVICRIIYASADCKREWLNAAGRHCGAASRRRPRSSINRPAECIIITAAGQIIRLDLGLCLFTCVCTVTAFVERVGACIIHIPWSVITWLCFLRKGKSILAVAAPLPRTVQSALKNSCWVLLWWIEFFSICADHAIFHCFVLIYGPLFLRQRECNDIVNAFSVIGETD
jgi:hypothetical protein